MTPYQFGQYVKLAMAKQAEQAYTTYSGAGGQNMPASARTGMVRLPETPATAAALHNHANPGNPVNASQLPMNATMKRSLPGGRNAAPPRTVPATTIMVPAQNSPTEPTPAERLVAAKVNRATQPGSFDRKYMMPRSVTKMQQSPAPTNAPAAAQPRTTPVTTRMDGGTYSQQVGAGRQPVPGTGVFRAPGMNERIPDSALPPVPKLQPKRSPYGE
jgi:hypothetical protein